MWRRSTDGDGRARPPRWTTGHDSRCAVFRSEERVPARFELTHRDTQRSGHVTVGPQQADQAVILEAEQVILGITKASLATL